MRAIADNESAVMESHVVMQTEGPKLAERSLFDEEKTWNDVVSLTIRTILIHFHPPPSNTHKIHSRTNDRNPFGGEAFTKSQMQLVWVCFTKRGVNE